MKFKWNPFRKEEPISIKQEMEKQQIAHETSYQGRKDKLEEKSEIEAARRLAARKRREALEYELIKFESGISHPGNPEQSAYTAELMQLLKRALDDPNILQPHLKEMIYKYFFEEKTPTVIAEETNNTERYVRAEINLGLKTLKDSKYFRKINGTEL